MLLKYLTYRERVVVLRPFRTVYVLTVNQRWRTDRLLKVKPTANRKKPLVEVTAGIVFNPRDRSFLKNDARKPTRSESSMYEQKLLGSDQTPWLSNWELNHG
jgi:hypothetical protein